MAKIFYTLKETAAKLHTTEDGIKQLVRDGKLREFRDGGGVAYKVDEVDALGGGGADESAISLAPTGESGIELAPIEESDIQLSPSGSDVLSLKDADDTAAGSKPSKRDKEGSVVSSIGVSVFDEDELDIAVDPLAQTQISDVGSMGLEGVGSGSGILDLSRERDDTSLGAELLDEIYDEGASGVEMGEATRAGLDAAVSETVSGTSEEIFESAPMEAPSVPSGPVLPPSSPRVVYTGGDAAGSAMTALMAVAVIVLLFGGLVAASLVQGVTPTVVRKVYENLAMFVGGAAGAAVIASVLTYFVAKRG